MAMKKKNKKQFDIDDYIKANKAINRLEELERNGGRWIVKDRPHKNKKKYDRKKDRRIDFDCPFCIYKLYYIYSLTTSYIVFSPSIVSITL